MKTSLKTYSAGLTLATLLALAGGAQAQDAAAPAPAIPDDPVARAAYDMLDKHCARCHQDGMLVGQETPSKNFGHVLSLDKLASDPHYIVPGNPDGSKLVQQILNQEMPYDLYYLFAQDQPEVTESDLVALRTWVEQLGAGGACDDREFISPFDQVASMAADIDQVATTRVIDTRYVTLTNLYNACTPDEDMEVYRQGTVKLLNSLSRVSDVVRMELVDEAGTILRFNLKDIGWTPTEWDLLLSVYPYGARPDTQMFDVIAGATATPLPYVRGDWLSFTASRPPLYEKLLGLADDFFAFERQLGLDTIANINAFTAKRSGFQKSGVSQNNRLIERHTIATGYFWTSYDFAGNRDRQSLFQFPLGPGKEDPYSFDHDGGETIFSLPNGFQGYYLNAADGTKLAKGPTEIVRDPAQRDFSVTNGISCMGCHDQGMRKAKDDVRDHVTADRTFPRAVQEAVEALYPTRDEMDAIIEADGEKFRNAMLAAGLEPTLKLNGIEMINALSKRYESDLGLELGAAEFGQDAEEFVVSLRGTPNADAIRLNRRLDQGAIPRDTFEGQFIHLVEHVSDLIIVDLDYLAPVAIPVAPVARPPEVARNFDLTLVSDRSIYRVNEQPVFTVYSDEACYLTLINVDSKGTATVIFPNQFQQDNFLPARRDLDFPAADAPFVFRLADPGIEKVIATCSLQDHPVDDITIDYSQAFTGVGNYEQQITRAIKVEARPKPSPQVIDKIVETGVRPVTRDGVIARRSITVEVR